LISLGTSLPNGQKLDETAKLLPADGAAEDFFGNAVATNGEIAVVGAWFDDNLKGSAYIFRRNGDTWSEEEKLIASDGSSYDFFGHSVAIYEDNVIIGASGANNKGAAYIFHYNGNSWTQSQKLTAGNGMSYDSFGFSVSLDEDYALVGAVGAQTLKGAVYIFKKNGSSWQEEEMLTGPLYASSFGSAVDISDETILIGASDNSYAFTFMLDNTTWVMTAELQDLNGSIYDEFGATVSIDGDLAVVGATHHQNGNGATGAAYIYKRQGSNWVEEEKIVAEDGELDDHFGVVSMFGSTVVVGAYHDDDYGLDAGTVYLYQKENDNWEFKQKLFASDGFAGDELGSSIAVFSDVIVAGAPDDNDNGSNSGSAYVFNYDPQTGIFPTPELNTFLSIKSFPNPFHEETNICYKIKKAGHVQVLVYDKVGQNLIVLVDEKKPAGNYNIKWNGADAEGKLLMPGLYFYKITIEGKSEAKPMLKI